MRRRPCPWPPTPISTPTSEPAIARFALARALDSSGPERTRATLLARQAAEDYAETGPYGRRLLEEIEAWPSPWE